MDYMEITVNDDKSITVNTGAIQTRALYEKAQATPYA
jgi:hypothetical protein